MGQKMLPLYNNATKRQDMKFEQPAKKIELRKIYEIKIGIIFETLVNKI